MVAARWKRTSSPTRRPSCRRRRLDFWSWNRNAHPGGAVPPAAVDGDFHLGVPGSPLTGAALTAAAPSRVAGQLRPKWARRRPSGARTGLGDLLSVFAPMSGIGSPRVCLACAPRSRPLSSAAAISSLLVRPDRGPSGKGRISRPPVWQARHRRRQGAEHAVCACTGPCPPTVGCRVPAGRYVGPSGMASSWVRAAAGVPPPRHRTLCQPYVTSE